MALTQRATIVCDCIVDDVAGTVQVIEANLVEQTVDYLKNSSKYEEINQYIGYREDKNYGTIFAQCMIRNTLGAAHDAFKGFAALLAPIQPFSSCVVNNTDGSLSFSRPEMIFRIV